MASYRPLSLPAAIAPLLSLTLLTCGGSQGQNAGEPGPELDEQPAPDPQQVEPLARIADDMRELLVDLGETRICPKMRGQILGLSSSGASPHGSADPTLGVLWVESCNVEQVDPTHLRVQLGGKGWRWVSRQSSKLGATFEVDHNARFAVDLSMVVTGDLAYDPAEHILTMWMLPTRDVQVDLNSIGDIAVEEETLWAEIVGGAASLIGQSPGARAESRFSKQGSQSFEQTLAEGLSLAVNMCTGRQVVKLGTLEQGVMPDIALDPKGQLQRGTGRAALHDDSLLLFGPYRGADQLKAELVFESEGSVRAELMCEAQARRYFQSYLDQQSLPEVDALERETLDSSAGDSSSLTAENAGCPVVLALRPAQRAPVELRWAVYEPGRGFEPVIPCISD